MKFSTKLFPQKLLLFVISVVYLSPALLAGEDSPEKIHHKKDHAAPTIMVTFTWSFSNIGDIGITPGIIHLIRKHIPDAEIILVANAYSEEQANYFSSRFQNVKMIPSPFKTSKERISLETFRDIQIPPQADPFHGIPNEKDARVFQEAFNRSDLILYNSGTTLSYGRWGYSMDRTMRLAWPLFLAQRAGKPYGIYCQSFERFAWPSNELFVPMLSDADFVFCRDGNSLEYLKSLGVAPAILEYGPDATFAFQVFDKKGAQEFMKEHELVENQFITLTIRSGKQGFLEPGGKRELAHAAKLRDLVENYVESTGNKVLICPEVKHEIEPARKLILESLSEKARQHVVFLENFWLPDLAYVVYSKAEAVVSMEAHSVIMALSVGTPVLHPRFLEAGRKAWMLKDLGLEEWLFDIDNDSSNAMLSELIKIHDDFENAKQKVETAMKIVTKRQEETMKIVKETVERSMQKE